MLKDTGKALKAPEVPYGTGILCVAFFRTRCHIWGIQFLVFPVLDIMMDILITNEISVYHLITKSWVGKFNGPSAHGCVGMVASALHKPPRGLDVGHTQSTALFPWTVLSRS